METQNLEGYGTPWISWGCHKLTQKRFFLSGTLILQILLHHIVCDSFQIIPRTKINAYGINQGRNLSLPHCWLHLDDVFAQFVYISQVFASYCFIT
jgi:hypothetical protein